MSVLVPRPLDAQWPGEIRGRVVDELSGDGVPGADVFVPSLARSVETGARGGFHLRGLEPGHVRLRVSALGYADRFLRVEVRNGRVSEPVVRLTPTALAVRGVEAEARGPADPSADVVEGAELDRSAAVTLGGLVEGVPGLVVRRRGAGGGETVSIRGSDADEVLVLVDGAPLNDPVTGEADLSTVPASTVERITVVRGARSARYGARAQAGAVLVETRAADLPTAVEFSGGSLGRVGGRGEASSAVAGVRLGGAVSAESVDGSFRFQKPDEVGGGTARRRNADRMRAGATATLATEMAGGELSVRAGAETLERGIPGKSFAPSDAARQEMRRARASARWSGPAPMGRLDASAYGVLQRVRFRDPAPPLGIPYDDRTDLERAGLRLELEEGLDAGWLAPVEGGLELDHTRVRSDALEEGGSPARTDAAVWARGGAVGEELPGRPRLDGALRLHRDAALDGWRWSHDVTLSARAGGLRAHLGHRSAYSPPTLGDQFFREGVGVRPNPDLRAERIPSEVELDLSWSGELGGLPLEIGGAAWDGDVRGMIVWAPDFRFVWSPRNVDVKRRGAEARLRIRDPARGLAFRGSVSRARIVYDRPGPDTVQVRYRPRHTATLAAGWDGPFHHLGLEARYLGTRYPVPAPVNALPPLWTVDLDLHRDWRLSGWTIRTGAAVRRLLGETGSFFFGFPEPGRTVRVSVEVRPPG